MIIALIGNLGSGKTLYMAWSACHELEIGNMVFTTFRMKYESSLKTTPIYVDLHRFFDWLRRSKTVFPLWSACVLVDEANIELDSRKSLTDENIWIAQKLQQSRKFGFNLMFSGQLASAVDLRLRKLVDLWIVAMNTKSKSREDFNYIWSDSDAKEILQEQEIRFELAKRIFPTYRTQEIIESYEEKKYGNLNTIEKNFKAEVARQVRILRPIWMEREKTIEQRSKLGHIE